MNINIDDIMISWKVLELIVSPKIYAFNENAKLKLKMLMKINQNYRNLFITKLHQLHDEGREVHKNIDHDFYI